MEVGFAPRQDAGGECRQFPPTIKPRIPWPARQGWAGGFFSYPPQIPQGLPSLGPQNRPLFVF